MTPSLRSVALHTLFALMFAALIAPRLPAQVVENGPQSAEEVISVDALRVAPFHPNHIDPGELMKSASRIFGRRILVGEAGNPTDRVSNLERLGESVLVIETADRVETMLERLTQLDLAAISSEEPVKVESKPIETLEWTPRHVSINDAIAALHSYNRNVTERNDEGETLASFPAISAVHQRGLLVLRETAEHLAAMHRILENVDRPAQNMVVTALVVEARERDPNEPSRLPDDLVANLGQLVPFEHFRLANLGMVRTTDNAPRIELHMIDEGSRHELRLVPAAFDTENGDFTVDAQFESTSGARFGTRIQLNAGEYTVLGATGSEPIFVVLKIQLIDG